MAYKHRIGFRLEWNEDSEQVCRTLISELIEVGFKIDEYACTVFCEYEGDKYSSILTRSAGGDLYISIFEQEHPAETVMRISMDHIATVYNI